MRHGTNEAPENRKPAPADSAGVRAQDDATDAYPDSKEKLLFYFFRKFGVPPWGVALSVLLVAVLGTFWFQISATNNQINATNKKLEVVITALVAADPTFIDRVHKMGDLLKNLKADTDQLKGSLQEIRATQIQTGAALQRFGNLSADRERLKSSLGEIKSAQERSESALRQVVSFGGALKADTDQLRVVLEDVHNTQRQSEVALQNLQVRTDELSKSLQRIDNQLIAATWTESASTWYSLSGPPPAERVTLTGSPSALSYTYDALGNLLVSVPSSLSAWGDLTTLEHAANPQAYSYSYSYVPKQDAPTPPSVSPVPPKTDK